MGESALHTNEWRLPGSEKPPLIGELVERIDEAVAIARASEAAVMTVGAAALDAAEQARRAAELAERASAAMRPEASAPGFKPAADGARPLGAAASSGDMESFAARADRVAERLRRLQRVPLSA
jgi:hypothetical protein